jgi:hypothetical protein
MLFAKLSARARRRVLHSFSEGGSLRRRPRDPRVTNLRPARLVQVARNPISFQQFARVHSPGLLNSRVYFSKISSAAP